MRPPWRRQETINHQTVRQLPAGGLRGVTVVEERGDEPSELDYCKLYRLDLMDA